MAKFESEKPDVVLLDVMMPEKNGFDVCREIRMSSNVPIIMVTARGEDFERIMGLEIRADDYIVKPFSPAEVIARIKAVLRRLSKGGGRAALRLLSTALYGLTATITTRRSEGSASTLPKGV